MWKLRDLKEYIEIIERTSPEMLDAPIVIETPTVWRSYALADGCTGRYQHGQPPKIVFRVPGGVVVAGESITGENK